MRFVCDVEYFSINRYCLRELAYVNRRAASKPGGEILCLKATLREDPEMNAHRGREGSEMDAQGN